jgi:hypothetical protein
MAGVVSLPGKETPASDIVAVEKAVRPKAAEGDGALPRSEIATGTPRVSLPKATAAPNDAEQRRELRIARLQAMLPPARQQVRKAPVTRQVDRGMWLMQQCGTQATATKLVAAPDHR